MTKTVVYMATNEVNGKRYIGVTARFERRKQEHNWASTAGFTRLFNRAIRKYGFDSFEFTILKEFDVYEDGIAAERDFIAILKPEYNLTAGGESTLGYKHTPDQLAKRSLRPCPLKGKPRSPETIAKMSASLKGKKLHLTDEARAIRVAQAALMRAKPKRPHSKERREWASHLGLSKRRQVLCLNTGETFESARHADRALDLYEGAVSRSATMGTTTGGRKLKLKFRYVDETPEENARRCRPKPVRRSNGKSVICLNDDLIFQSALAADSYYGLTKKTAQDIASGRQRHCRGLVFCYVENFRDDDKSTALSLAAVDYQQRPLAGMSRSVMCLNDGKTYPSAAKATRAYGLPRDSASQIASGKKSSAGGYRFVWVDTQKESA
jgi:group I intron endonuclease